MNNTLSFPRLMKLMRKHWNENLSFFGIATLAMFGILAIVLTIWVLSDGRRYSEDSLYIIYLIGLFIMGCILASVSFSMLGDKAKGGYWLALPASHLEKLITVILFTSFLFFAVYSLCFFTLKAIAVTYIESKIAANPDQYSLRPVQWEGANKYDGFGIVFRSFIYGFFAVQALFLMGSAYFSKFGFIKTIIIAALIVFLFVLYTYKLGEWLIPKNTNTGNLMEPSETTQEIFRWIVTLIWAPLFWLITWFRLKEKEL